jgi:hypothetical protein
MIKQDHISVAKPQRVLYSIIEKRLRISLIKKWTGGMA